VDKNVQQSYGKAISLAFEHLMENYPEVFLIGQGLWSPWYVGNSMQDLDKKFGKDRVIDSPVSEDACTGIAIGASLCGFKPVVIHPRLDFMILATNQIVNQAAKWSHMLGGQAHPAVTIRGIINRGGEQGAQHSQALHSWYAHVPGLRVVMPSTPTDARDLLIASVLCQDPVMYIDDRWLYELEEVLPPIQEADLRLEGPRVVAEGSDVTLVGCGYSAHLCRLAAIELGRSGITPEVIDLRVINPFHDEALLSSVKKTAHLVVVDGGWKNCGLAAEVIARVTEQLPPNNLKKSPLRLTLPDAPAPTSKALEKNYYHTASDVAGSVRKLLEK